MKPTKHITLNAKELGITATFINYKNRQLFCEIEINEKKEEVKLTFSEELIPTKDATLTIDFSGELNEKLAGFYRSSFEDTNNKKSYIAITQFEATDARRAFPCWDEPNIKATFDITMVVDSEHVALSNMHVIDEKTEDGKKHVKFATTPIMSTYLVAFAVGPLEFVERTNKNGTLVRVYTTPGFSKQGEFGLDCACRILEFFSDYFGIPYPMKKMDMIAVPDFAMGAMENWGLVTYRTTALLFDPKNSTIKGKQYVTAVIAHELAHQWFGNLVTMDWWTDLWLNEGFATWAGTLATDFLFPEWKVWTEFIVDDLIRGLNLDCLRSSHPIEVDVKNPGEINQIFDAISYSKGASVIRMLVGYLGENPFKFGIRKYLNKFQYRNATTNDLWDSLAEESGKPVKEMMTNWTRQMGYPLVSVQREGCCCLKVTQNRYLATGKASEQEDTTLWRIPLGIFDERNSALLSEELSTRSKSIEIGKDSSFVKINKDSCGFYRTFYSKELLDSIGNSISAGKLSPEDRIGILNDAFSLASSGHQDATVPLSLIKHFYTETNYMVWMELSSRLSDLQSVWWEQDEQVQKGLEAMIRDLCKVQVARLGFNFKEGEDDITGLLRVLIIRLASRNNDESIKAECKRQFDLFVNGDENAIHPDLRGVVFASVVQNGGKEEFEKVLDIYKKTTTADIKLQTLKSLCETQSLDCASILFEFVFSDDVKSQDIFYVLACASYNPKLRRLCWKFVSDNWQKFNTVFESGSTSMGEVATYSCRYLTSDSDADAVELFFSNKCTKGIDMNVRQAIEKIRNAAKWLKADTEKVAQWILCNC